ncbi:MAG: DNA mismatch repair protein MutS [Sphingobacteriaceae bacterium]|nr:MAG: DNA mismatch repair protein MutS [Sphingobacteriaceae bacterium]
MQDTIINQYKTNASLAQQEAVKYKKLADTYSLMRLTVFGLMILSVSLGIAYDTFTIIAIAFPLLVLSFAWLVSRQSVYDIKKKYYQDLQRVNENEIGSITNRDNLYDNGSRFASEKHFYTADLDIFGSSTLFQLVNRAATTPGNEKLADWLSAPADKATILLRQEAVKELSAKNQWKLELQTLLLFAQKEDLNQLKKLFVYLHIPLSLTGEKWLNKYVKIAPYLLIGLIVLAYFYSPIKGLAILTGIINLGIVSLKAAFIKKADLIAGKIGDTLSHYAAVFKKIEVEKWQAVYTSQQAQKLLDAGTSAKLKELADLINKLNYHLNIIVGVILNLLFLWDIKQIIAIENWKRNNADGLEMAFDVIAEYEALISLAGLRINYPDWTIPQIADSDGYTLTATEIAHPLIPAVNRVVNDYELNDTHKVDIITGSNMAGKSTFLRTMGINTVLALCGAPVCAKSMQVSVMTMVSYMRIKDSLNESTSTFKAELDRLQMLLAAVDNEPKVFFLIDEMLRGTNSVDKYRGSKAVIELLIKKKGVGMVATHDLQIAQLEQQYPDYVRNFYFDIQVKDGEMLFDYKMKHGECKTFNATLLLKQIGIDIDTE